MTNRRLNGAFISCHRIMRVSDVCMWCVKERIVSALSLSHYLQCPDYRVNPIKFKWSHVKVPLCLRNSSSYQMCIHRTRPNGNRQAINKTHDGQFHRHANDLVDASDENWRVPSGLCALDLFRVRVISTIGPMTSLFFMVAVSFGHLTMINDVKIRQELMFIRLDVGQRTLLFTN